MVGSWREHGAAWFPAAVTEVFFLTVEARSHVEVLLQDVALLHLFFEQRPLCLFSASSLNFSLPKGGWTICVLCPRWCVSKCFWFLLPCEACSKFLSGVRFLENSNVCKPIGFALMLTQQSVLIVRVGAKPICQFLKKTWQKVALRPIDWEFAECNMEIFRCQGRIVKGCPRASSLVVWLLQVVTSSLAKNANNILLSTVKYCKFINKVAVLKRHSSKNCWFTLIYRDTVQKGAVSPPLKSKLSKRNDGFTTLRDDTLNLVIYRSWRPIASLRPWHGMVGSWREHGAAWFPAAVTEVFLTVEARSHVEVLLQDVALLHLFFEQRPLCLFSASSLNFSLPKGGWTIYVLCPRWCVSKCFWFLLPCEACSKFLSGVRFLENSNVCKPIGFALMLTQQSVLIVRVGAKPICQFLKKTWQKVALRPIDWEFAECNMEIFRCQGRIVKGCPRASSLVVWLLQVVTSSLAKNANNILLSTVKYCKFINKVAVLKRHSSKNCWFTLIYRDTVQKGAVSPPLKSKLSKRNDGFTTLRDDTLNLVIYRSWRPIASLRPWHGMVGSWREHGAAWFPAAVTEVFFLTVEARSHVEVLLQDVALLHLFFEQRPLCLFSASSLNFSLPKGGWTICVLCPRWCVSKCFWFLLPCEACSKFLSGVRFLENSNVCKPIGFALMLTQQSVLIVRVGAKPICQFLKKTWQKVALRPIDWEFAECNMEIFRCQGRIVKGCPRASSLVVWLLQVVTSSLAKNANNILLSTVKYCKFINKVAVLKRHSSKNCWFTLIYRDTVQKGAVSPPLKSKLSKRNDGFMWLPSISGNFEAIRSHRGVDWTCPSACSRSGDRDWVGSYPSKTAAFHPKNDGYRHESKGFFNHQTWGCTHQKC